ncbi:hypothetical protein IU433_11605 [Nocardia puris]|uniref:Uncharacterized protein n=1 Tax=Nocardia puris TaxID=208602 RepID=A0A366DR69_9NOCA|nr:hypothetical protein [Nocardia puris]MBF6214230.1 hypothetical protein [Nocardia puris]MBF6365280.1 hypothetical protein [Nocardia puris]MBF6459682.1 hypothetical protein [Nocardia puris]RBO91774.1 hypothetical protein DFR74_104483 [Nocardia puris]
MAKLGHQSAEILITVKTYPSPSVRYEETVCVAGVRLDGDKPEWIRLYPVRFRGIDTDYRFDKYARVSVDVQRHGGRDPRLESFRPDQYSLKVLGSVPSGGAWTARRNLMGDLIGDTTTCELISTNANWKDGHPAPRSLGLIEPRIDQIYVSDGKPWDADQLEKIRRAGEDTLLGPGLPPLEPMPYEVRYRYRCAATTCSGHTQKVLDWELGEAGRQWKRAYGDAEAKLKIEQKWGDEMCDPSRDLHFYLGNQARRHHTFSILGTWYALPAPMTLF